MFHHNKTFMKRLAGHQERPFVFHMCWTSNRAEKVSKPTIYCSQHTQHTASPVFVFCHLSQVHFFKQIGMWFIPDQPASCSDGKLMLRSILDPESVRAVSSQRAGFLSRLRGDVSVSANTAKLSSNTSIVERCCMAAPHWKDQDT